MAICHMLRASWNTNKHLWKVLEPAQSSQAVIKHSWNPIDPIEVEIDGIHNCRSYFVHHILLINSAILWYVLELWHWWSIPKIWCACPAQASSEGKARKGTTQTMVVSAEFCKDSSGWYRIWFWSIQDNWDLQNLLYLASSLPVVVLCRYRKRSSPEDAMMFREGCNSKARIEPAQPCSFRTSIPVFKSRHPIFPLVSANQILSPVCTLNWNVGVAISER